MPFRVEHCIWPTDFTRFEVDKKIINYFLHFIGKKNKKTDIAQK
jgi:hypothetical protein